MLAPLVLQVPLLLGREGRGATGTGEHSFVRGWKWLVRRIFCEQAVKLRHSFTSPKLIVVCMGGSCWWEDTTDHSSAPASSRPTSSAHAFHGHPLWPIIAHLKMMCEKQCYAIVSRGKNDIIHTKSPANAFLTAVSGLDGKYAFTGRHHAHQLTHFENE